MSWRIVIGYLTPPFHVFRQVQLVKHFADKAFTARDVFGIKISLYIAVLKQQK